MNAHSIISLNLSCFSFELGTGALGAEEIKRHAFFREIDWKKLAKKEINAPFKPNIGHSLDTSNFSGEFTNMPVQDSPCKPPPNHTRLFRGKIITSSWLQSNGYFYDLVFHFSIGFSFVAPDLMGSQTTSTRPTVDEVLEFSKVKLTMLLNLSYKAIAIIFVFKLKTSYRMEYSAKVIHLLVKNRLEMEPFQFV